MFTEGDTWERDNFALQNPAEVWDLETLGTGVDRNTNWGETEGLQLYLVSGSPHALTHYDPSVSNISILKTMHTPMHTQVNHSGAEEGVEGRCTPPSHAPPMSFHQWALTTVLCFVSQLLLYSTEVSFCLYFMCSWTVLTPNGLQRCVSDSSKGATKVPEAPCRRQRVKFKTSRYSGAGGGISYTSLGRLNGVWKNPWPVYTSGRQGAWCQEQPQRNYA